MPSDPDAADAFFLQAASDWRGYHELVAMELPDCHALHYLQMAVEKLLKSHEWQRDTVDLTHRLVPRWRQLRNFPKVRSALGMDEYAEAYQRKMIGLEPILEELQKAAPTHAGNGPNCEYPWPPAAPRTAPSEYRFGVVGRAARLIDVLEKLFSTYDRWR